MMALWQPRAAIATARCIGGLAQPATTFRAVAGERVAPFGFTPQHADSENENREQQHRDLGTAQAKYTGGYKSHREGAYFLSTSGMSGRAAVNRPISATAMVCGGAIFTVTGASNVNWFTVCGWIPKKRSSYDRIRSVRDGAVINIMVNSQGDVALRRTLSVARQAQICQEGWQHEKTKLHHHKDSRCRCTSDS